MPDPLPYGPGPPLPKQSSESRRAALRGKYMDLPKTDPKRERKRRWWSRRTPKESPSDDRAALLDAVQRIDDLEKYDKDQKRDKLGRWSKRGAVIYDDPWDERSIGRLRRKKGAVAPTKLFTLMRKPLPTTKEAARSWSMAGARGIRYAAAHLMGRDSEWEGTPDLVTNTVVPSAVTLLRAVRDAAPGDSRRVAENFANDVGIPPEDYEEEGVDGTLFRGMALGDHVDPVAHREFLEWAENAEPGTTIDLPLVGFSIAESIARGFAFTAVGTSVMFSLDAETKSVPVFDTDYPEEVEFITGGRFEVQSIEKGNSFTRVDWMIHLRQIAVPDPDSARVSKDAMKRLAPGEMDVWSLYNLFDAPMRRNLSKADVAPALAAVRSLSRSKLDKLVLDELNRQAPMLAMATRRTINSFTASPEMRRLIRKLLRGNYSNWQVELEAAASSLRIAPKRLADALAIPATKGYTIPSSSMVKNIDTQVGFEEPDIRAAKWAYAHSGELVTTQVKHVVDNISTMVSDTMVGDMTIDELRENLKTTVKLPPRYANAVKRYRTTLKDGGKKTSVANRLADSYARRLLDDHVDTIARTEVMTALNEGQSMYWDDMVASGVLADHVVQRQWSTAIDERTCTTCGAMDKARVPYHGEFELPSGVLIHKPPAHPRCRCSAVLHVPDPTTLKPRKRNVTT